MSGCPSLPVGTHGNMRGDEVEKTMKSWLVSNAQSIREKVHELSKDPEVTLLLMPIIWDPLVKVTRLLFSFYFLFHECKAKTKMHLKNSVARPRQGK